MIVVSNATPLIALAKLDRLDLLQELFGTILIPQAAYDEVVTHAPSRPGATQVRPLLDELRTKKFHLSEKVYQAVLEEAGE